MTKSSPTSKDAAAAEVLKGHNQTPAQKSNRPPLSTQNMSESEPLFHVEIGSGFVFSLIHPVPRPGNSSEQMRYTLVSAVAIPNPADYRNGQRNLISALKKKKVVLLVHDFGSDHSIWFSGGNHLDVLIRNFGGTIIAVDLVGQCPSSLSSTNKRPQRLEWLGNDIALLINQLQLRDVTLVGAGLGCKVVLQAVGSYEFPLWRHPDAILRAVVLIDGDCRSNFYNIDEEQFKQAIAGGEYQHYVQNMIAEMFPEDTKVPMDTQERMMEHCCKNMSSAVGAQLLASEIAFDANLQMMDLTFLTSKLIAIQSTTFRSDGKRIPANDENDPWLFILSQKAPDARFLLVDCGHNVVLERPEAFCETMKNILFQTRKSNKYDRMISWDIKMRCKGYTVLPRLPS